MKSPVVDHKTARVPLETIIERIHPLAVLGETKGVEITDIAFDHRRVTPGALFCCLPGERRDGHEFAYEARMEGAVAFICEHSIGPSAIGAVQLIVTPGSARRAMASASASFYSDPAARLRTVGVTGTNGKTTTTYLLRSILESNGWRCGVIGTLDGARTTPESPDLQRALARQRDAGCVASAIEVTSHALVQHRVDEIVFEVAVFTNLTQDHLDFHKTMESYYEAKAALFTPARAKLAVVNSDDLYGRRLIDRPQIPTVSFGLSDAKDLEVGVTSSSFRLGNHHVRLELGGEFNVRNALGAAAAARVLGANAPSIVAGLEAAKGVPGRFEAIESNDGVVVLVDYAHTPAGLEEVLLAARNSRYRRGEDLKASVDKATPRLFVVFGCGGDRDRGKRPAMGAIASKLADVVILTSDNPRSEDPDQIIEEIRAGCRNPGKCIVEHDRRSAIGIALSRARRGDVVIVAGKGHETTQQFADHATHFDDREVISEELARLGRARRKNVEKHGDTST